MGGGVLCMYVPFFGNTPPNCNHHLRLGLCRAIAMHKSRGQTLDKAVIDLAQGGLYGAYFRLSQQVQETCGPHGRAHEFRQDR